MTGEVRRGTNRSGGTSPVRVSEVPFLVQEEKVVWTGTVVEGVTEKVMDVMDVNKEMTDREGLILLLLLGPPGPGTLTNENMRVVDLVTDRLSL